MIVGGYAARECCRTESEAFTKLVRTGNPQLSTLEIIQWEAIEARMLLFFSANPEIFENLGV